MDNDNASIKVVGRQLFSKPGGPVARMQLAKGKIWGMDYRRIRSELQTIRFERKMSVPELAEEASLAKSTLYRLEDVDKEPERTIDLETLEKLTSALDVTLSAFFARIEGLRPISAVADNLPAPISNPTEVTPHGGRTIPSVGGVPSNEFVHEAILIGIAEKLADRLTAAVERIAESRGQAATTRPHPPVRHGRGRKSS